jgi:8-oxo-dGTP pyrophosphatase MutT (NUDIX family)
MSEFSDFVTKLRSRVGAGSFALTEADGFASRGDEAGANSIGDLRRAAVALVLRGGAEGAQLLVIKRSEAERDHWSGHLALPGGRAEAEDESLLATAVRETFEEVGIDLRAGGEVLARLGTVTPRSPYAPRVSVTPFLTVAPPAYHTSGGEPRALELSEEVAAAFWVPVDELKRGGRAGVFRMAFAGVEREWPAYPSEHGMIWGITERILTEFLSLVD